ncbi:MAG: hypothetical protein BMS9Abin39_0706 [Ignavibacteria bacterium]|jgi:hypothetical protein|nr:MAG: hypothetical protein BMS9Abin39_0706 [Ignavibacteria bacterium]
MKKGCFLKFIIIFTIVLAAGLYLIQNKFEEFFFQPGKELILSVIENEWDGAFNYVKESVKKDSLKTLLNYYVSGVKSTEQLADYNIEKIADFLESTFKDSLISDEELSRISNLIEEALRNEE